MHATALRLTPILSLLFLAGIAAFADEPYRPATLKVVGPVRCRPTIDGAETGESLADQSLAVLQARLGTWFRVQRNGGECWIPAKNLRLPKDAPKYVLDCPAQVDVKPEIPPGFSLSGWQTAKFASIFVGGGSGPSGKNTGRTILNIEAACTYILGPESSQRTFAIRKTVPLYYDCPEIGTSLPPGVSHLECELSDSETGVPSLTAVKNQVANMATYDPKTAIKCSLDGESGAGFEMNMRAKSCDEMYPEMVKEFCARNKTHEGYRLKRLECPPNGACTRAYVSELRRCPDDDRKK